MGGVQTVPEVPQSPPTPNDSSRRSLHSIPSISVAFTDRNQSNAEPNFVYFDLGLESNADTNSVERGVQAVLRGPVELTINGAKLRIDGTVEIVSAKSIQVFERVDENPIRDGGVRSIGHGNGNGPDGNETRTPSTEIECTICMDKFRRPIKRLECEHCFCYYCLFKLQRATARYDRSRIRCPTCRQATSVPGCDLSRLPTVIRFDEFWSVVRMFNETVDSVSASTTASGVMSGMSDQMFQNARIMPPYSNVMQTIGPSTTSAINMHDRNYAEATVYEPVEPRWGSEMLNTDTVSTTVGEVTRENSGLETVTASGAEETNVQPLVIQIFVVLGGQIVASSQTAAVDVQNRNNNDENVSYTVGRRSFTASVGTSSVERSDVSATTTLVTSRDDASSSG